MKKLIKSTAGVTLLEIMLVLAIASMVIVMSVRYYQNATYSSNSNIIMEEIQNVTAAADNLAQGTGSYSGITSASITAVAGSSNMKTPYGSQITFSPSGTSSYNITIPGLPAAICQSVKAKVSINPKVQGAACSTGTSQILTYSYQANT